jgi:hypothetical protein
MMTQLSRGESSGVETLSPVPQVWTGTGESPGTDSPRIVAILPRGEAIRNFVFTGALDQVSRQAELTLLSVFPNSDFEEMLRSRFENVAELVDIRERWIVNIQREILDLAHGRRLWSEAARERWRLRDVEANTPGLRLKRWAKKLACYPFANSKGLEVLSRMERASSRWFRTQNEYVSLFQRINPSLVFNCSHVHSRVAIQSVQAANWLGIPTAAFIFSWDNLTSQGRIMPPCDYYLVWNEAIRHQLLEIYGSIRPEQVFVTGTPQFDFHFRPEFFWTREEFCSRVGADPARPLALYSTGMANHVLGEPDVVESIADMLKGMTDLGSPQLIVRIYPKDLTGRFEELKARRPDILFPRVPWETAWLTPKIEDSYLLTNMLRHADVGINIASTISLELCMFDKPVINVGYRPPGEVFNPDDFDYRRYYEFDHYRPVVESGAIMLAMSESEMPGLIRKALTEPKAGSRERLALIRRMFGDRLDGRSADRIAAQLLELAIKKKNQNV